MATEQTPPTLGQIGQVQPQSPLARAWAIIEVVLAFAVVHVAYRSFKHFTALGQLEGAQGLNFSPGTTMILLTLAMILVRWRSFAE